MGKKWVGTTLLELTQVGIDFIQSQSSGTSFVIPAMSNRLMAGEHRSKDIPPLFNAAVARPVSRREIAENPAAARAMQVEWDRLRRKKVWRESVVREWADVAREARENGTEVHMGYLFGICVEKNSEPAPDHPSHV